MSDTHQPIVFSDPLAWGPAAVFTDDADNAENKWVINRNFWGSTGGVVISNTKDRPVPELVFNPNLKGWHEVAVRVYHQRPGGNGRYGNAKFEGPVHVGTTRDKALHILRAETHCEDFETLCLGVRDLTDASIRLDGSFRDSYLDAIICTPCDPPVAWPAPQKEVCAILDFADSAADYRPMEACAAASVRVHADAGFTTLYWKSYAVRCEFHTKLAPVRSVQDQPDKRVNVGHLLEKYDTLAAAVAEARHHDVKLLGWMRINNEMDRGTHGKEDWDRFTNLPAFHQAHPEMRQRDRQGQTTNKMSFAYPEVRAYLCTLAKEILDHGTDGLMIDVLRHPPMVAYDQPLVEKFIKQTGQDPREMAGDGSEQWLRFRCSAFTDLLRDLRQMMRDSGYGNKELHVRAMPQPWRLLRDGCDVETWMQEKLVDTYIAGDHCMMTPGLPTYFDLAPIQSLIQGRAKLIGQVGRYSELPSMLTLAQQVYDQGADGSAIYESNETVTLPSYRKQLHRLRSRNPMSVTSQ